MFTSRISIYIVGQIVSIFIIIGQVMDVDKVGRSYWDTVNMFICKVHGCSLLSVITRSNLNRFE